MQGGRGGGPPPTEWTELYFHQKVKHLTDHGADFIFSKSKMWIPSICVSIAACAFLFGGEQAIPALMDMGSGTVLPIINTPMFGLAAMEQQGQPQQEAGEEEDAVAMDDEEDE
jgi:hypothetical protein